MLLEKSDSVKYLGVTIDSKLTWRQHILHLEKKMSTACALISKLRYYVDQKSLLQYYGGKHIYGIYGMIYKVRIFKTTTPIYLGQKNFLQLHFGPYFKHLSIAYKC